jgi:hypothetical protein
MHAMTLQSPHRVVPRASANSSDSTSTSTAPWNIGGYYTKRLKRRTDTMGNLVEDSLDVAEPFAWTPAAKLRLAAATLATELSTTPESLLNNIKQLAAVLPGNKETVERLRPADAVRIAAAIEDVPARLIALREALPQAVDVAALVARWPEAVLLSPGEVRDGAAALRQTFECDVGEHGVAAMISTTPQLLSARTLERTLRGAGHLMPRAQLADSLARYENWYLQFEALDQEPRNDYEDVLSETDLRA